MIKVEKKVNATLEKILAVLEEKAVYVGIPKSNTVRPEEGMTNATLLAIHSKGSPVRGLPARPVIEPAIEDPENKATISKELIAAARKKLKGDEAGYLQGLNAAGLQAQNVCQDWFENPKNGWEPLAEATVKAKLYKALKGAERKKAMAGYEEAKSADESVTMQSHFGVIPLVDTNEMRKAITYVVEE